MNLQHLRTIPSGLERPFATIISGPGFSVEMALSYKLPRRALLRLAGYILVAAVHGFAQEHPSVSAYRDPVELIRKAVESEVRAANDTSARFLFHGVKSTPKGSTTRIYIETKDATAGLVIAYNDKPLTPDQRRDEESRIERFVRDPAELQKKRQQERENADRSLRITRALPDAFVYEYAGEEPGSDGVGRPGAPLVKMGFRPNPRYQPPTRVEEVLTGMQGYLLIDPVHNRIAKIDGTLFRDVAFGWGILGHLDRGGRFIVQQRQVGGDAWEISNLTLDFTGKILLLKNLTIRSTEVFSKFKQVPQNLNFAEALELLKKEESATNAQLTPVSKLAQD